MASSSNNPGGTLRFHGAPPFTNDDIAALVSPARVRSTVRRNRGAIGYVSANAKLDGVKAVSLR